MIDNFYLSLAAILLIPLIPAYILYKFLPASDTDVSGPYSGLSLKLKGAFAGYFLLVLVGLALQYSTMNNKQQKTIESLNREIEQKETTVTQLKEQLAASANAVIDWKINGLVKPSSLEGTRFFYDDGTTEYNPDGSFQLIKRSLATQGMAAPPKWMCIYNLNTGFKVISFNREVPNPHLVDYGIVFKEEEHKIIINKPIEINSKENDSVVAVANYIEKYPELKTKVQEINPQFLEKAEIIRKEQQQNKVKLTKFNAALKQRASAPK